MPVGPTPRGGAAKGGSAALWCGQPMGPLLVSFGLCVLLGNGDFGFCGIQFQEYFQNNFYETKNIRKQELALWHLVNMLVPENAKKYYVM